jgi:hypothetical protein
LCALGALLWTSRNDFLNFVRPAAWSGAIVLVVYIAAHVRSPVGKVALQTGGAGETSAAPSNPASPADHEPAGQRPERSWGRGNAPKTPDSKRWAR